MSDANIYTNSDYLVATGSWHAEDSPWKAAQVLRMLEMHDLHPTVIGEVGCGAGVVLQELSRSERLSETSFEGYDISPQAIALATGVSVPANITYLQADPLDDESEPFDLLLALDVLEHVPDYMGFLTRCQRRAELKIYHIPLDVHASSVLRNSLTAHRYTLGHLHYFVADSALATLRDTGHEVIDYFYTGGAIANFSHHRSLKRAIANVPRRLVAKVSVAHAARFFGGFSLLVLAR